MDPIKVLWIDDESINKNGKPTNMCNLFVEKAIEKGIEITPISSWEEGVKKIKSNPYEWFAVILDVRNQAATKGGYADDFMKTKKEIEKVQSEYNQTEPYIFPLSGEKQYQDEGTLIEKKDYASKRVYNKNSDDYKILFDDINKLKNVSTLYKCQCEYSDVLQISKNLFGEDAYCQLFKLILQILQKNNKTEPSMMNDMRKFLEEFVMEKLEEEKYDYFLGEEVSMNGLPVHMKNDKSIPIYVTQSFFSIVKIVQEGSHAKKGTKTSQDISKERAPYVLRSCLFELFNIIIWMDDWSKKKPL